VVCDPRVSSTGRSGTASRKWWYVHVHQLPTSKGCRFPATDDGFLYERALAQEAFACAEPARAHHTTHQATVCDVEALGRGPLLPVGHRRSANAAPKPRPSRRMSRARTLACDRQWEDRQLKAAGLIPCGVGGGGGGEMTGMMMLSGMGLDQRQIPIFARSLTVRRSAIIALNTVVHSGLRSVCT
jgi:hypothetical protein